VLVVAVAVVGGTEDTVGVRLGSAGAGAGAGAGGAGAGAELIIESETGIA